MVVIGSRSGYVIKLWVDLRTHCRALFLCRIEAALYFFIRRPQVALVLLLFPEFGTLRLAEACLCSLGASGQLSSVNVVRARAWVQIGLGSSLDSNSWPLDTWRCFPVLAWAWTSGRLVDHVIKLSRSVLSIEATSFGRCTPSRSVLHGAWVAKLQIVAGTGRFPTFYVAVPVVSIRLRNHCLS